MRAIATGLTDVGLQREHNEDSFVVLQECDLFIVADGMGGHRAGDVASRLATETIADFFRSTAREDATWPFHFDTSLSEEENRLLTGIRIANRQIFERSAKSREYRGMGTTVVGALFSQKKGRMYIGHVGDSRCYRVRSRELRLLTRDHSLINDYLLAMPDLTEEQKNELPKNVITRALGMQDQVMVDLQTDEPRPGDLYLLCSDGLSGMLADGEILEVLMSSTDVGDGCRRLIDRANAHGGEDNITAVLVRIEPEPSDSSSSSGSKVANGAATEGPTQSTSSATTVTPVVGAPSELLYGPAVPSGTAGAITSISDLALSAAPDVPSTSEAPGSGTATQANVLSSPIPPPLVGPPVLPSAPPEVTPTQPLPPPMLLGESPDTGGRSAKAEDESPRKARQ